MQDQAKAAIAAIAGVRTRDELYDLLVCYGIIKRVDSNTVSWPWEEEGRREMGGDSNREGEIQEEEGNTGRGGGYREGEIQEEEGGGDIGKGIEGGGK